MTWTDATHSRGKNVLVCVLLERKFDWGTKTERLVKPSKGAVLDDDKVGERRAWEILDIWCNDQSSGERKKSK
jgi:hypothetical protein